ncbi:MFS transporter [Horticoccus sp. 23ND18S-11]|uniref:MFS transporter n=1 Tax=Horticoccus sp. 23ND18S-11 TaxID=3391832 RepID=UPI0039C93BC2
MFTSLAPRWRLVLLLAMAAALNYADRAAFSSVLPPLRAELGLSDTALGLMGSLFLWSYALASPVAGILADRYSRRMLVLVSLAAWSAVTLATGAAGGVLSLALLRIGLGVAESLYLPAATALLADHHDTTTRGRAMGLHSIGLNCGVVVGGAFAGYSAQHFGWRTGFVVLGLAGILLAVLARNGIVDAVKPAGAIHAARPTAGAALRYLMRVRSFYVLLLKTMLAGFTIWIFLSWLPLYFNEAFHMTLGAAGFAGTFMLQISTMLGIAGGGWISDRVARRSPRGRMLVLGLSYVCAAPFLLIFLQRPGFAAVIFAVSAFSFLRGLGEASEKPALCDVVPACFRSTALGLMNTCATAAGGVGVLLAGILKRGWGLESVFAGSAAIFIFAGVWLFIGYRSFMAGDIARARAFEAQPA